MKINIYLKLEEKNLIKERCFIIKKCNIRNKYLLKFS